MILYKSSVSGLLTICSIRIFKEISLHGNDYVYAGVQESFAVQELVTTPNNVLHFAHLDNGIVIASCHVLCRTLHISSHRLTSSGLHS